MAQPQATRSDDFLEDIGDWISRRNAQAGDLTRKAEAKGRQIWNDATRTGQNILGRTQSELRALGAAAQPAAAAANSWLNRSEAAKYAAGGLAENAGQSVGVGRGVLHSAEGIAQGLRLAARLNPESAQGRANFVAMSVAAANYINKRLADPASIGRDLQTAADHFVTGIDPAATPMAPTFTGEMARRFGIGANQGELGWDVGSLALGSPALKAVEGLGAVGDASEVADFVEMGFSPAQAERLAEPYHGVGHHSPLSQSLAKKLGVPDWIRDSSFNVVKPDGMNQGDFYRFHFETDPKYYGSGFSPKIGGPGWSGKRLGFQKYGLLKRFWYGTPTPLAGVSATAGATGLSDYDPTQDPTQ